MKLDIDCVRDIMLWIEETTTPTRLAVYIDIDALEQQGDFLYPDTECRPKPNEQQQKLLKKYSNEVLVYHLNHCVEAELLALANGSDSISIIVKDLTPKGHDFIANIRESKNFKAIKTIVKIIGVESIRAVTAIASKNTFQNIDLLFSALEKFAQ